MTRAQLIVGQGILLISFLISAPLCAQVAGAELTGTVTDPLSKIVPNARVSLKNAATGQSTETQTDSAGLYDVPKLLPGDYEVSVSAAGFSTRTARVTITEGSRQTMDLKLGGVLSLEDLGFSPAQAQGSAQDQAKLDKRSKMLRLHQKFGLITTIPLFATVLTGSFASSKSTSSTGRDFHAALGSVTVALYGTTAYYAIFAPKVEGTPVRGNIRLHKALAWVHGAGMILTPLLGGLADEQRSSGEKVHGIASAHGAVGIVTVVAYAAAILTESLK